MIKYAIAVAATIYFSASAPAMAMLGNDPSVSSERGKDNGQTSEKKQRGDRDQQEASKALRTRSGLRARLTPM